jgi:hypothetical protein
MDALLEVGLPPYVQCTTTPRMGGAREPGTDITDVQYWNDHFIMNIQWFGSAEPVNGLLMYDAGSSQRLRGSLIPEPQKHNWLFFGYRCERCQHTFLVPSSLKSADYLPNVLHHSCHGDGSADYAERRIREGAQNATFNALNRLGINGLVKIEHQNHVGSILVREFDKLALSIWQEAKNF